MKHKKAKIYFNGVEVSEVQDFEPENVKPVIESGIKYPFSNDYKFQLALSGNFGTSKMITFKSSKFLRKLKWEYVKAMHDYEKKGGK